MRVFRIVDLYRCPYTSPVWEMDFTDLVSLESLEIDV